LHYVIQNDGARDLALGPAPRPARLCQVHSALAAPPGLGGHY